MLHLVPNHWDDEKTEIWQPPARFPAHTPPPMPAPIPEPLGPALAPLHARGPHAAVLPSPMYSTSVAATAAPRRRWPMWCAIAALALALLTAGALLGARAYVEHVVRSRALPALAAALDQPVGAGDIDVSTDQIVIHDLTVGELGAIDRVVIDFTVVNLLERRVRVDVVEARGVSAAMSRNTLDDLLEKLSARVAGAGSEPRASRSSAVDITGARFVARQIAVALSDRGFEVVVTVDELTPQSRSELSFTGLSAELVGAPGASRAARLLAANPVDGVSGTLERGDDGSVQVAIAGHLRGDETQRFRASGDFDPANLAATDRLRVGGEAVSLDRLLAAAAVITGRDVTGPLVDTAAARLGGDLVLIRGAGGALAARGVLDLDNLTVANRRLARAPVAGISGSLELDVAVDPAARAVDLNTAIWRPASAPSVSYQLRGAARANPRVVRAHLEIPEADCAAVLASLPPAFVPEIAGFELRGRFAASVDLAIDWSKLAATVLDGSVGIDGCEVAGAPAAMSAERLRDSFEHTVPVGGGQTRTYVIGPENPDFVRVDHVSRNLIRSLLTTEDGSFFRHRGFRTKEFRTALIKNLERGHFAYGASSISMQMVKNVMLSREKTVSRKLQELFLTWYVEGALPKNRILEIYLNAIEFGPGLYGIKPAAAQYFGKHPRRLNPVESAFFSSILPAPRRRFRQYCRGYVGGWTRNKMDRIIDRMFDGNRLDPEQYLTAIETPLIFRGKRHQLCKGVK